MLRCFLIGGDSLLVECGETLLRGGHAVLGVVTSTPRIAEWARQRGIPVHEAQANYASFLSAQPFDYLFSITHLAMIPAEVLRLPQRGAVNFHDGPLPRYAGLNAPAWALLNGEEHYGISWHRITEVADTGDLLKQVLFDIAPDETSLTLNTKCFQAALDSFAELVGELDQHRETNTPQDLSQRTCFGKFQRPAAACFLDWHQPADRLEAFLRALDFGRYWNPLGTPKLQFHRQVIAVRQARADDEPMREAAGTIVGLDAQAIRVATGTGSLWITEFASLSGRPLSPAELADHWNLRTGDRFETLSATEAEARTAQAEALGRSESFWLKRLRSLQPLDLSNPSELQRTGNAQYSTLRVAAPAEFLREFTGGAITPELSPADVLTIAWTAFLARITARERFDLGFRDESLRQQVDDCGTWIAPQVPLRAEWQLEETFTRQLPEMAAELQRVRGKRTWLWDLVGRSPELREQPPLAAGRLLPMAVEQADDDEVTPAAGVGHSLVISSTGDVACVFDDTRITEETVRRTLDRFLIFLRSLVDRVELPLGSVAIMDEAERGLILEAWNDTETVFPADHCIHHEIERQAQANPDRVALVFEDQSLTYAELDAHASRLAQYLRSLGVGADRLVGICLERSLDLVVGVLATLKAGGAYVPLDPDYPRDRLAHMLEDSQVTAVLTHAHLGEDLPTHGGRVVCLDTDKRLFEHSAPAASSPDVQPHHLAYVIYTSGSTGKPKGVMVEHRQAINFFVGMDQRLAERDATNRGEQPGTWLAVTSLSFDISVLELLWTLSRGFRVVLYRNRDREAAVRGAHANGQNAQDASSATPRRCVDQPIDFSLFYFSSSEQTDASKYQLLLEGARFADEHGFTAVWTPERHFSAFGGLYPNPAVTGAAVAAITHRVQVRAGSVVLPLHHPARVAEEWSVVDNLSGGRVGVSFAAGWQPNDFLLRPESYADAKRVLFRDIETVQRLWRGESVEFTNGRGEPVSITTHPRPVQETLPVWVTTAGNLETYQMAGAIGANLLTHLLGQSLEELAPKIAAYRRARAENGFDPDAGIVSLMLHTYVTDDADQVRETVRGPLRQYLSTALNLLKQYAWSFPAFRRPANAELATGDLFAHLTDEERDALLEHAFERYYETSGLFGRPEDCVALMDGLKSIGVNDVACLVDFGVPTELVLRSLPHLDRLRTLCQPTLGQPAQVAAGRAGGDAGAEAATCSPASQDQSLAALVERYQVTHLQCTPSMARMLTQDSGSRNALRRIRYLLIGGEAFPLALARELDGLVSGTVMNMYGPTETTVWSSTQPVVGSPDMISIGRPIANTQMYVLDARREPVPTGEIGELYIGGAGVTRGYLRRPELTAERFVPNPFRREPNARMYRTGDLARFLPDGSLEFLGRVDHQVKIRGYRIELGEIESLLGQHPAIRENVVVAREDQPGDQRLTAYYVARETDPGSESLKEYLRSRLPSYMVPSQWLRLPSLPQTPNGKIDRRALPAPGLDHSTTATSFVAPEGELQQKLAELWKSVLGREQLGIDDNFFDLGGHSLLVVVLHRQLREQVEPSLSLTDLYRFPTIRTLCDHLANDESGMALQQSVDRAQRRREAFQRRRGPRGA